MATRGQVIGDMFATLLIDTQAVFGTAGMGRICKLNLMDKQRPGSTTRLPRRPRGESER